MKTVTETRNVGEWFDDIEWDRTKWPFQVTDKQYEWFKLVVAEPDAHRVTADGGWPGKHYQEVYRVGMYDGWPYWRQGPALLVSGALGTETMWLNEMCDVPRRKKE